jgi:glycosyltransferase involved in cell wall biosynthesis
MSKPFRLAVINSHPIQYFAPLFRYLNRDADLAVTALYGSDFSLRGGIDHGFKQAITWDVDLLGGYESVFLGEAAKTRNPAGFWSLVCPQVWSEVRSGKYDALLIHGYSYAVNILGVLAAKSKGIPVFVRSETQERLPDAPFRHRIRDAVLSLAYRFVDGFFAIGTSNTRYYRQLGIADSKIFRVPYTVDNDRFTQQAALAEGEASALRAKYNIPEHNAVILYASKFMARKHPDDLIAAVSQMRESTRPVTLFMVGTGELHQALQQQVRDLGMQNVVFGGFVNQALLPKIFAISDVFVLPSEKEPWGLIVNEAMCAGLPIVLSEEIGCVPDLVFDGRNGYLIDAGDVSALSKSLDKLVADDAKRIAMGRESLAIISEWSYEQCRIGVLAALRVNIKEHADA